MSILRETAAPNLIMIEKKSLRDRLMLAASMGMMTLAAPAAGIYGTRASAQSFPAECVDEVGRDTNNINDGDGDEDPGETIFCDSTGVVSPGGSPVPIGTMISLVDDLSIVIGEDRATQVGALTNPASTSSTVFLDGFGDHGLTIYDGSSVEKEFSTILYGLNTAVVIGSADGHVTLKNDGIIQSGAYGEGVAVGASVRAAGGDLIIDSSNGVMIGSVVAASIGTGKIDLDINSIRVSSDRTALDVDAGGLVSDVNVATTGRLEGGLIGIDVINSSPGGSTTITTEEYVSGKDYGIKLDHNSGGIAEITANGAVYSQSGVGIHALGPREGGSLTINANNSVNGYSGIYGQSSKGLLTITSSVAGAIDARNGRGIDARNEASSDGALTITAAGAIRSSDDGIYANSNIGSVNITTQSTATVTASGAGAYGVYSKANNGTQRIRTRAAINSKADGIRAIQTGTGDINIYSHSEVESEMGSGIYAKNDVDSGNINVSTYNDVTGNTHGIRVNNYSDRVLQIQTTIDANTIGKNGSGIKITSSTDASVGFLTDGGSLPRGEVLGAEHGIYVKTAGGRIYTDSINNDIRGTSGAGFYARSQGGDIELDRGIEINSSGGYAIDADSAGGALTIANASISGVRDTEDVLQAGHAGIKARSGSGTLTIRDIGDINVKEIAVDARSEGGAVNIEIDGVVTAGGEGLYVSNIGAERTDITLQDDLNAAERGISLHHNSSAAATITLSGAVSDGFENSRMVEGVSVKSQTGADLTIKATGSVEGETFAISFDGVPDPDSPGANFETNDTLTLEEGASIDGDVLFNAGDDVFDDESGLVTYVSGGEGFDIANLSGRSRTIAGSGDDAFAFEGFEVFNLEPGDGETFIMTGLHEGLTEINFDSGRVVLDGALEANNAFIGDQAVFNARDGAVFTGTLTNTGTLEIGSSPGIFTIVGDFIQMANDEANLPFEIANDGWDQLFVTGTATLAGDIDIDYSLTQDPGADAFFTLIDAELGRFGEFNTPTDNLPDVDFAIEYTDTGLGVSFVAPVMDDTVTDDPVTDDTITDDPVTEDLEAEDVLTEDDPDPVQPLLSQKEIVPSSLSAAMFAGELFTETLTQRRVSEASKDRWNFFSVALGGQYDVGNDDDILGWDGGTSGLALGAERYGEIAGHPFQFGLALGHTVTDLDTGPSHAEIDNIHLGFFANVDFDALHLNGAIAHAWNDYDFQRVIVFGNGPVIALGETEGSTFTLETEGYYDFFWSPSNALSESVFGMGPVITIDNSIGHMNRFKEKHVGILNLTYTGETSRLLTVGAGAAANYRTSAWGSTLIDTGLRLTFENTTGDNRINTDAFLAVAGAVFNPTAATLDAERIAIGTDTKIYFTDRLFGQIRYDTRRGENLIEHEGWAGLTLKF